MSLPADLLLGLDAGDVESPSAAAQSMSPALRMTVMGTPAPSLVAPVLPPVWTAPVACRWETTSCTRSTPENAVEAPPGRMAVAGVGRSAGPVLALLPGFVAAAECVLIGGEPAPAPAPGPAPAPPPVALVICVLGIAAAMLVLGGNTARTGGATPSNPGGASMLASGRYPSSMCVRVQEQTMPQARHRQHP